MFGVLGALTLEDYSSLATDWLLEERD
jgi:hypothetical protein